MSLPISYSIAGLCMATAFAWLTYRDGLRRTVVAYAVLAVLAALILGMGELAAFVDAWRG